MVRDLPKYARLYSYPPQIVSKPTGYHVETKFHTIADGRTLAYVEYGAPAGIPVFYAHGGPGSRLEGVVFHEAALQYGFRLIATDRPGMGQSTFLPDRTLLDYPKDISSLADALSIDRFGVLGWSGGGAHTTVCAYAIPDRLLFNISLCGYTNFAELPDAAGMLKTKGDRFVFRLAQRQSPLFDFIFRLSRWGVMYFPNATYQAFISAVSETDRKVLGDSSFKAEFLADQREAFVQGGRGVAVDSRIHYEDWGFRLQDIPVVIHVFHGTEDRLVPVAYAEHIGANVPGCNLHILEGQGHLFPMKQQDLIFKTALDEVENGR
jgi:pimeloyl-ACP methyl ester carboxylesterase